MDYLFPAALFFLIIFMVDIKDHNKKVEDMFPDHSDGLQNEKRHELTISTYGCWFILLLLAIGTVNYFISMFR